MDSQKSKELDKKLNSIREAIDKAEQGYKKQEAQKHYQAAQQAKMSNDQDVCEKECDAAMETLKE